MDPRRVDKKRSKEARARQEAGVARLDYLFGLPEFYLRLRGMPIQHGLNGIVLPGPPRTHKGCPPDRDPATKARHLKRKRATAARRLTRANG